ncbi:MAG: hypothetical protein ACRDKE_05540 [Solirubrobacterales bacterium]
MGEFIDISSVFAALDAAVIRAQEIEMDLEPNDPVSRDEFVARQNPPNNW